jgi:hypothetical protein
MKIWLIVFGACLLASCGSKKSDDASPAPQNEKKQEEKGSQENSTELDATPVEMKADSFFKLTRPFTQWQLNTISWDKPKGKQKGVSSFDNVVAAPPAGQPNYRHYTWGWSGISANNCGQKDKTSVKLFLDAIENFKVKETLALDLDKVVDVDPSKYAYNLRVEVQNDGNCDAVSLELGVMIRQ